MQLAWHRHTQLSPPSDARPCGQATSVPRAACVYATIRLLKGRLVPRMIDLSFIHPFGCRRRDTTNVEMLDVCYPVRASHRLIELEIPEPV